MPRCKTPVGCIPENIRLFVPSSEFYRPWITRNECLLHEKRALQQGARNVSGSIWLRYYGYKREDCQKETFYPEKMIHFYFLTLLGERDDEAFSTRTASEANLLTFSIRGWRWSLVFYSSFKTMFKTFFSRFSFVLGVFIFTNSNICFCTCKTLTDLQHYQKCNNVNFFKPWIFILVMVDNVEQYDVSTFDSFQPRCSTTIEHFDNQYTFVYRHISLLRSESLNQRVCWFHF